MMSLFDETDFGPVNSSLEENGAKFSDCRKYRFALWRKWDHNKPLIMFIGLNPSTADETEPDPTITRVIGFANKWGYGGVYMMNLFPFVTAYPEELEHHDIVQQAINDHWLETVASQCSKIIFAWGNFKIAGKRAKEVMKMFPNAEALILNKNGSPRHPLYVKGDVVPVKFVYEKEVALSEAQPK